MTVLRTLPIEGHSHLAIDTLGKRVYVLHSGLLRRYRFADAPGARIGGGPVTTQPEEAADALANTVWLEGIPVGAQSDSPFLHRPTARLYWTALAPGGGCKIERSFLDGRGCEVVLSSLLRGSRAVGAVVSAEGLVHAAYVSVRQPGNASLLMVAEEKSHATDANPLRVSVLTIRRGIAPSALMTFGPHLFYSVTASRAIYRCGLDGSECILIVRGDVGMASGAEVNGVLYSVSKLSAGNQANQFATAKVGGMPPLIMWLESNAKGGYNADAPREATSALLAVATNNEPLQGLITRFSKGNLATHAAAARTLWHLAGNCTEGEAIAAASGMQPLCSMLSSEDMHAQVY